MLSEDEIEKITNRRFDPAGSEVIHHRESTTVVTTTVTVEITDWLVAEATARGATPNQLLSQLLAETIAERTAAARQAYRTETGEWDATSPDLGDDDVPQLRTGS